MQKTSKIVLGIFLCFICFTANAQKENKALIQKENVLKINLSALAFKNISLQYETKIGRKRSLALNLHTIPFGDLPFQSIFDNIVENVDVQYDKVKLGNFGIVPEVRFYLGKKAGLRGFYIGPFVSYNSYKINLPIQYNNSTKTGIFDGNLKAITVGFQLGTQFRLGKNMVLDWWIIGPNYGSENGKLSFAGALTPSEQSDLQRELGKLKNDAPFNTIKTYTVSSTGGSIIAKGPWGGLRGLGFNLGFIF